MSDRGFLGGLALLAALGWPGAVDADVIHLVNGSQLEVEAWRDVGDAIEFTSGGGIVRISKSEVRKIDGKPTRGDLKMYSSGVSGSATGGQSGPLDQAAAVKQMADLLKEGEALFTQPALTPTEKASAFRRLGERWRELEVPDPLRGAYTRGQQALQLAFEAFTADSHSPGEANPDVRARVEKAKAAIQGTQEDVKKLEQAG